jgi:hypothetical protein
VVLDLGALSTLEQAAVGGQIARDSLAGEKKE